MSQQFNPAEELIDFKWAENNGWEINGLLAYRHILFEFNRDKTRANEERIQQILMTYPMKDFDSQVEKINNALNELIKLKEVFDNLG